MNNQISVIGTIATDPKSITTRSGVTLCTFRLASGERRYDRAQQKWVDGETNWFGVTAFRALADHAAASFRKGERVIVTGRLRVRQWENDEKSGTSVDIEAEALGHDLRWGVSSFEKRLGADGGADRPETEAQQHWGEPASDSASASASASASEEDTVEEGEVGSGSGFLAAA
ncbi:single-stranded DNA-binding protein [Leucobacter soli]|uniref:Single-stranded DNA-binding protein n=1 Tax=Leucobacter soli TaxID=2812850 RepID=A0A916JTE0_9MICO|nr:single-stranded DNA-binding protein [Leucobacter soli]CAG7596532.1 Single-stranded DNA-binding protein 1 [Leucobacter soli]